MKEHIIHVDTKKCIGCGLCKRDCPVNNISVIDKKAVIIKQDCIKCGHCVGICPKGAVSMTGFHEPPIEIEKAVTLNPKQLLQAIKTRRTIRQFTRQSITSEIIADIIESGRFTPTAENAQDVSYIVLKDNIGKYEKIAVHLFKKLLPIAKLVNPGIKNVTIDNQFFFKKAPAAIMVLSKNRINASLAASNMELMAEAHGLGVLYSGLFTIAANISPKLRKALHLKQGDKVVTTLVLGYPGVKYHRIAQKDKAAVKFL